MSHAEVAEEKQKFSAFLCFLCFLSVRPLQLLESNAVEGFYAPLITRAHSAVSAPGARMTL